MKDWDWDERGLKVSGDVENLKTFMNGKFELTDEKLDSVIIILGELRADLYGKDSDTPGMKIKVDRLEQARKKQDQSLAVVYGTTVALILKALWDYITKPR